MKLVEKISNIDDKRLFFVGDIHGMFYMMEDLLDDIGFDKNSDILISVGDIIDRGPSSHEFIEYIEQPWFYSVMGNHENMMLNYIKYPKMGNFELWINNGGDWWNRYKDKYSNDYIEKILSGLPLILDIEYRNKKIGVTHSQRPIYKNDWNEIVSKISKKDIESIIWDRNLIKLGKNYDITTKNVDLIIHGHTITKNIVQYNNHIWIDTGAYSRGVLTIIELNIGDDNEIKIIEHRLEQS